MRLRFRVSGCTLERARGEGILWLDGWLQLRCAGLISSYVRHLKGLFHWLLNEFYKLSICALSRRDRLRRGDRGFKAFDELPANSPQQLQQGVTDYDSLALEIAGNQQGANYVFFGVPSAIERRTALTNLVKGLVELEGHLL